MASAHTHISAGLLLGVVVGGALHLDAGVMALFAVSSGGAALLPDADTKDSAVHNAGGLISKFPLWCFRTATHKHRGPTHSPFFLVLIFLGVCYLGHLFTSSRGWLPPAWPDRLVLPALLAVLFTRTALTIGTPENFRPLLSKSRRRLIMLFVAFVVGYCGYVLGAAPHFALGMALSVGAGYASHLLTDWTTARGIPLKWPFSSRRYALANIKVGGFIDYFSGVAFFVGAVCLFIATAHGGTVAIPGAGYVTHSIGRVAPKL